MTPTNASAAELQISAATREEFDWCAELIARSEPWKRFGLTAEKFRPVLDRPATEVYIARRGDAKLGFVRVTVFTFSSQPLINTLVVEPEARNQGIGSALLRFVEQRFAGLRFIFLQVSEFNRDAQRLYQRHGFVQVGELPDSVEDGHSELLLAKRLRP